ncbi:MAG: Holliday junction branch migration protein RuvA [Bacilli bacterium]
MYNYIKGIIKEIGANYIVLDNNDIGYQIYTPNPYIFKLEEEYLIYLYQHIREDENSLFGFKTINEKELFLKLISVKGLGPKMTLPILATGSVSGVIDAIERENILYLKKFPKIGDKVARQIILDLKGQLVSKEKVVNNKNNDDLIDALKALGYKNKDIINILPKIKQDDEIEIQIKEALKLLLK